MQTARAAALQSQLDEERRSMGDPEAAQARAAQLEARAAKLEQQLQRTQIQLSEAHEVLKRHKEAEGNAIEEARRLQARLDAQEAAGKERAAELEKRASGLQQVESFCSYRIAQAHHASTPLPISLLQLGSC